jgi:hypothetical protein
MALQNMAAIEGDLEQPNGVEGQDPFHRLPREQRP